MIDLKPASPQSMSGTDDVRRLKHLAAGVGWEFSPTAQTTAGLKKLGIKSIRCINVDTLEGAFDEAGRFRVTAAPRLDTHLQTCREIGANPHIIIAQSPPAALRLKTEDLPVAQGVMGLTHNEVYGPTDWNKFSKYCEALIEYVLITKNFPQARFEVGNEPDIGGSFVPSPPKPPMGSTALYEAYFKLYKSVAAAAGNVEAAHPNLKVTLGGPALAWAFSFRFGDFNWAERFLRDCGLNKVKLDFIGVHWYGNISSLEGEYPAHYPSLAAMLKALQGARDSYVPGTPIWLTEWGASYQIDVREPAINGNHVGAAHAAATLDFLLRSGVEGALYLVTTDLHQPATDGAADGKKMENVWGWPSLFVSPVVFGEAFPKAPQHVFDMISRLSGQRITATKDGDTSINCFASADKKGKKLTILIWNYDYRIPESGPGTENARTTKIALRLGEATKYFGSASVRMERWMVSETTSNAYGLFRKGEKLDQRATLQKVQNGSFPVRSGTLDISFTAPPSSVSFVVLSPEPNP